MSRTATEYVLVYAKDEERAKTVTAAPLGGDGRAATGSPTATRLWKSGDSHADGRLTTRPMVYGDPVAVHWASCTTRPEGRCWRNERSKIEGCRRGVGRRVRVNATSTTACDRAWLLKGARRLRLERAVKRP